MIKVGNTQSICEECHKEIKGYEPRVSIVLRTVNRDKTAKSFLKHTILGHYHFKCWHGLVRGFK